MTRELKRSDWKTFFDELSRDLADWDTTVQVFNNETGAQVLSEGLPFNGLTFNEKGGKASIELSIGSGVDNHQTHNIVEPLRVAFEPGGRGPNGTLDIEDVSGTKTLITFIQPMPVIGRICIGRNRCNGLVRLHPASSDDVVLRSAVRRHERGITQAV